MYFNFVELSFMNIEERVAELEKTVANLGKYMEREKRQVFGGDLGKVTPNELAKVLRGLAHPIRVTILTRIADGGKYHNELAEITGLTPGPLNFHLGTLRTAGLLYQETIRGKYVATDTGSLILSMLVQLSENVSHYEVAELDRYCLRCGKAKMKVAIFPHKFQAWCPACGEHEEGPPSWKWTMTGFNPYGEDWKHHNIEDVVDEGWKESESFIRQSVKDRKCPNCGSKVEYTVKDDRTYGRCPPCEEYISMGTQWATTDTLLPFWRKHKKIKQEIEGPVNRDGMPCWKVTLSSEDKKNIVTQYLKTRTGEVLETVSN